MTRLALARKCRLLEDAGQAGRRRLRAEVGFEEGGQGEGAEAGGALFQEGPAAV